MFSLITPLCPQIDFSSSILGLPTPNCLHLPLHPGSDTELQTSSCMTPTHDSPSGASQPFHVPSPQPRALASVLSAQQPLPCCKTLVKTPMLQETSRQHLVSIHRSGGWREEGWSALKSNIKTPIQEKLNHVRHCNCM